MSQSIRVVVVDDHPVVRAGIVGICEGVDGIDVVAQAGDGAEAVALARSGCDVVLMDLRMPRLDGAAATAAIRQLPDPPAVVVLTVYDTDADILRAVEAGASGYLLKDAPAADLVQAVRLAARGETVLAPPVASRLVDQLRQPAPTLTPRERQVLAAVAQGRTNQQIAHELHVTQATVKTHLVRIFAKLDAPDRTRAVTAAMERGLI
jgi:DNA-binding NarL/FixJ family response regulator